MWGSELVVAVGIDMAEVHYGRWEGMFLVPCNAPDLGHTEVLHKVTEPQLWARESLVCVGD